MEENNTTQNTLVKAKKLGFSEADLTQINASGIDLDKIEHELSLYKSGIPKTFLEKPATINNGIISLSEAEINHFIALFEERKSNYTLEKFVPASGAASRMFKFLSEFLLEFNSENETINAYINRKKDTSFATFLIGMDKLPFFTVVYDRLKEKYSDFDSWKRDNKNEFFVKILLDPTEFDFANKPKGVLPFHDYNSEILTPIEEHLKEALAYAKSNSIAKLHFTISGEHKSDFEKTASKSKTSDIQIYYSEQLKSTDTIAVDHKNNPLRDSQSKLIFRPGGHGALIHNLNKIESDLIFIKNIDNVSHNNLNEITLYKKVLAGYLIEIQNQIFEHLNWLQDYGTHHHELIKIRNFIENKLKIQIANDFENYKTESQITYLKTILDRPIRVCGMVKNENEPGGGPFWIREKSGSVSLQIVENSQIDIRNENQIKIFKSATHFNPVDIVCGLKNYKSQKFNLLDFVDNNSGFIVEKSKSGIHYKAYELPGLWNGAMANWTTIFIEVPLSTFNPVKTVNDLLKPNHQPF
jgi:Domain of unknown function (DUF4301)